MSHRILNISFAEIRKIPSAISKLKGCEELKDWICPIENHFLWSATTTITGKGKVIWAKFISFLGHIINQHKNHKDPLFNKCAHGELNNRTWLTPDILLTFMEFLGFFLGVDVDVGITHISNTFGGERGNYVFN